MQPESSKKGWCNFVPRAPVKKNINNNTHKKKLSGRKLIIAQTVILCFTPPHLTDII